MSNGANMTQFSSWSYAGVENNRNETDVFLDGGGDRTRINPNRRVHAELMTSKTHW